MLDGSFQRAIALHQQGQRAAAENLYRAILRSEPQCAPALQNLGAVLIEQGRYAEALSHLEQALALEPGNPIALNNHGNVLAELGRDDEALASYDEALKIDPEYVSAFSNRSHVLLALGRPEEALNSAERALALKAEHVAAINNRGKALAALGRNDEALQCFDTALQLQPAWPVALVNRSALLLILNRPAEALHDAQEVLRSQPRDALALNACGGALRAMQQYHSALHRFEDALLADPKLALAHYNQGMTLIDLERPADALRSFDRALQWTPDFAEAHYGRGIALMQLDHAADAAAGFARALALQSDLPYARGFALYARMQRADWLDFDREAEAISDACVHGQPAAEPFSFLSISASAFEQLHCARQFAATRFPGCPPPLWHGSHYRHARLRLGYLSGDLGNHPVSYLMTGVFEHHDRRRFETIALSLRPPGQGEFAARVRAAFDRCIDVSCHTDHEIATLIRELEIDILVDLMGYTRGTRFAVLMHRPAPLQLSYLGYPGSLGSSHVDYLIADEFVIPAATRTLYTESIVYLPDCFQANDAHRQLPAAPSRSAAGLPDRGLVLCCFNTCAKITPSIFDVWCRVLLSSPDSVLWLLAEQDEARSNLLHEAQARGVPAHRLVFATRLPYEHHLARLQLADLFLDTYPFNAGSTASDALRAGVPVITCAGEAFASRMAGSLIRAVGLPELVTGSLAAYQSLAIELACHPQRLADIHNSLQAGRARQPLFDSTRFCRHLEQAYAMMHDRLLRGEAPASFGVQCIEAQGIELSAPVGELA